MQDLSVLEPIAVTGATGFIGKHLVRALVDGGRRPILLARPGTAAKRLSDIGPDLYGCEMDLTDSASVRDALEHTAPSTVFHLAGTRGHGDHDACVELNCFATVRLLKAAMIARVRRIVIMGSAEEYGNQPGPLTEASPARAVSPYGISKAMATNRAVDLHARDGCPVVVLRPFSVYGPSQPRDMFIAEAIDSALRNVEFKMTRGEQKRDLVFVDDIVSGLIAAASAPGIDGSVINLGSGECHRLREAAELVWKLTETNAPLRIGARAAREEELYDTWADITLARRLLDWEPRVNLESGIRRTIDFEKDRLGQKTHVCQMM